MILRWEDPLEKETATHSNILAWEIPWTEEPGGLQSCGSRVRHDLVTKSKQHNIHGLYLLHIIYSVIQCCIYTQAGTSNNAETISTSLCFKRIASNSLTNT